MPLWWAHETGHAGRQLLQLLPLSSLPMLLLLLLLQWRRLPPLWLLSL